MKPTNQPKSIKLRCSQSYPFETTYSACHLGRLLQKYFFQIWRHSYFFCIVLKLKLLSQSPCIYIVECMLWMHLVLNLQSHLEVFIYISDYGWKLAEDAAELTVNLFKYDFFFKFTHNNLYTLCKTKQNSRNHFLSVFLFWRKYSKFLN